MYFDSERILVWILTGWLAIRLSIIIFDLKNLSGLFRIRKKIIFSIKFAYIEVTCDSVRQRIRRRNVRQRYKGFREPPTLVFGLEFTNVVALELNLTCQSPTAKRVIYQKVLLG